MKKFPCLCYQHKTVCFLLSFFLFPFNTIFLNHNCKQFVSTFYHLCNLCMFICILFSKAFGYTREECVCVGGGGGEGGRGGGRGGG